MTTTKNGTERKDKHGFSTPCKICGHFAEMYFGQIQLCPHQQEAYDEMKKKGGETVEG